MAAPPVPTPMRLLGLLWRADHALGRLSRQMLRELGVTSPQRLALRAIAEDGDLSAATLARRLHVDRSSVTGMLRRLRAAGLVELGPHPRDRRRTRLSLSPRGRELDGLVAGTVEAAMARTIAELTDAERQVVARFLEAFGAELGRERAALSALESGR